MTNIITVADIQYIIDNPGLKVEKETFFLSLEKLSFKKKFLSFFKVWTFHIFTSDEIRFQYKNFPADKVFIANLNRDFVKETPAGKESFVVGLNFYTEIFKISDFDLKGGTPMKL